MERTHRKPRFKRSFGRWESSFRARPRLSPPRCWPGEASPCFAGDLKKDGSGFGLAAWVLVPNPYPWYGLWLVALAGLAPRSRAGAVAILLSLTALLRYVPDAIAIPSPPIGVALGIAAALPLLGLCYNERPA